MEDSCFNVAEIPRKGRGLIAARDISGGETVLRDTPLLLVVDEDAKAYCCSHCFRMSNSGALSDRGLEGPHDLDTVPDLEIEPNVSFTDPGESFRERCEDCCEVWFCGSDCRQEASGSSHSPLVCRILSKLTDSGLASDEKNQARFSAAAFNLKISQQPAIKNTYRPEANVSAQSSSTSSAMQKKADSTIPSFDSLLQLDGKPSLSETSSDKLHTFLEAAITDAGQSLDGFDQEMVDLLLCKDQRNSYGIMAPNGPQGERRLRASGTYTRAALINHDCLPNVTRFDYFDKPGNRNTDVLLRALHDIPAGTEICQSYFPISWPYELRQERLLEEYGFACTCQRCQTEQAWSDGDEAEEPEDDEDGVADNSEVAASEAASMASLKGKAKVEEGEDVVDETGEKEGRRLSTGVEDESGSEDGTALEGEAAGQEDFGHAMFFVKYLCPNEDCGGTMAPLEGQWTGGPPGQGEYQPAEAMECNMCGLIRTDAEFEHELACFEEEQSLELS